MASVLIAFGIAHYINISTQKQYALTTTIMVDERQNPLFLEAPLIYRQCRSTAGQLHAVVKPGHDINIADERFARLVFDPYQSPAGTRLDLDILGGKAPDLVDVKTPAEQRHDFRRGLGAQSRLAFE